MDKQMMVILPTIMKRKSVPVEESSRVYQMVEEHTKYRFTLEEAFNVLQSETYMFKNMVLHNVCMRDILRDIGARALVKEFNEMFSPNDKLKSEMDRFVETWEGRSIADFDIQIVSKFETIDLGFGKIHGLEELERIVEKSMYVRFGSDNKNIYAREQQENPLHVGEVWTPYPTFDSDDNDSRSYQNYVVWQIPISNTVIKELANVENNFNCCRVHEKTPAKLLPIIYYDGDSGFMLLAKRKIQNLKMPNL